MMFRSILRTLMLILVVHATYSAIAKEPTLQGRDGFQILQDTKGRTISAKIRYVGEHYVYLERSRKKPQRIERTRLSETSLNLIDEWKAAYQDSITSKEFKSIMQAAAHSSKTVQPLIIDPESPRSWMLNETFSDEFNTRDIDENKWDHRLRPWGERSWSADNLWQKQGSLFIQARYEPHNGKNGKKYFYKLGILQSKKKTTYGYFEARIKGCSRFPGLCPAFWLYSNGRDLNPDYPHITYSEIDIVEMLQAGYSMKTKTRSEANHIDLNLHTREMIDGVETWRRPQQWPEVCKNIYEAPWDPRDDFHLYACENTPEKITWYIDGIKVAESPNHNWHLPMSLTLTMELRPPLIAWAGEDGREPVPENSTPQGFPTHMEVDYVRSWTY